MMLDSKYVALGHELPTRLPLALREHRERLRFARWLVMTGRLSDWGGSHVAQRAAGRPDDEPTPITHPLAA